MSFRKVWTIDWWATAKRVWVESQLDDAFGASAQLAFYFMMGFFPFVAFLAALAITIAHMPPGELERSTFRVLADVMPSEALQVVESNVTEILNLLEEKNVRLLVIGALLALWPASGGMRAVIVTLNRAYNVREGRGPWRLYALSLVLTLALSLTLLVGLPLLSFASSIRDEILATWGPAWATAWHLSGRAAACMALVFGLEIIYYFAPNARRPWHWITAGSIVAVIVWIAATWLFAKYVSRFGRYDTLYAGLGAPVVLLLWFYQSGLAIMIGGEINAEIERQSGLMPKAAVAAPEGVDAAGHDMALRERLAAESRAAGLQGDTGRPGAHAARAAATEDAAPRRQGN
jgi:membrane protein